MQSKNNSFDQNVRKYEFGKVMKSIRIESGMTQKEFSENVLGISERQLKRIEKGENSVKLSEILTIISTLDYTPEEIYNRFFYNVTFINFQSRLLKEFRRISFDTGRISKILDELTEEDYEHLSFQERTIVDLIQALIISIDQKDELPLQRVLQDFKGLHFNKQKFSEFEVRLINYIIIASTRKAEIVELMEVLHKQLYLTSHTDKQRAILAGMINAIGGLITTTWTFEASYFEELEDFVLKNKHYTLTIPLYRHYAIYLKKNNLPYEVYATKAIQLAQLLQSPMYKVLLNDFKK